MIKAITDAFRNTWKAHIAAAAGFTATIGQAYLLGEAAPEEAVMGLANFGTELFKAVAMAAGGWVIAYWKSNRPPPDKETKT